MRIIKLLVTGLAVLAVSGAAMASELTIKSNDPMAINATCNGIPAPQLPGNGQVQMSFFEIALLGGSPVTCKFTESSTNLLIAVATLNIASNFQQAEVTVNQAPVSPFSVTFDPADAITQPVSDLTVTLSKESFYK